MRLTGEGMVQHDTASVDGGTIAQMHTERKREMRKNANAAANEAFWRLGCQLAASPTPQAFAWAAVLICRSAGIPDAADQLQGLILSGGG